MLTTFFANSLRNNESKWKESKILRLDSLEQVNAIHDRADSNICSLRSMLTMSDGVCISSFLDSQTNLESSIAEQKAEHGKQNFLTWCLSLEDVTEGCIKRIIESWKLVLIEQKEFSWLEFFPFACVSVLGNPDLDCLLYEISVSENHLSFIIIENGFPVKLRQKLHPSLKFRSVFKCKDMIALISKENFIRIYNMKRKLLHRPTSIDVSLDVIWFSDYSNDEVSLVGWNSKMRCIQSVTNNVLNWKITCLNKPKSFTMNDCTAAFLDVNNNLTFYNSSTKLSMEVLSPHHAMSRIDKISFAGHDSVFFRL